MPAVVGALADVRRLGRGDGHPPGCALRRPDLAGLGGVVVYVARPASPRRGPAASESSRRTRRSAAGRRVRRILVPMKLGADRRGDGRDGRRAREGARGDVEALYVIRVPLDAAARRAPTRRGGAGGGVARGGAAARRGQRRRASRTKTVRARAIGDGDRRGGEATRRRPDRARLLAALAPPVALLLADGRVRPAATRRARCSSSRSRRACSEEDVRLR